ncbi:MAG: DUF4401 domain-containing protein [Halomonas sp.]|nr:DUF4401 domain-containing protein [Halomonas sp.]TVP44632.1 MAG: DUF4401 domain-containing protein [Halomonas sp.]
MTHTTNELTTRLTQAGITLNEPTLPAPLETPWFVRALQAFSGWLAALFLLGFIAVGAVFIVESPAASMGLGLAMVGAAFALLRSARSDVLEHLALAISLAGQLLIAWALVELWETSVYPLWTLLGWSLLGLQSVLALIMPSSVHRTFSAFAASLALYIALVESAMAPAVGGVVLLALTLLWLNEFRWPGRIRDVQAWGYGLLIGLLVIQGVAHSGQPLWLDNHGRAEVIGLARWLNATLVVLSLVLLGYSLQGYSLQGYALQGYAFTRSKVHWSLYLSPVALLLVALYVPGVGQGMVVVLLGFAIGHRVLVGLGVFSLLMGMSSYYYWLDATLLTKSLTLLIIGALLLALRWAVRRWRIALKPSAKGAAHEE